jgi:hypothetical protein
MKQRYYFDTSVFGGVFDEEFSKYSIQLFDQVKRGRVVCLYSELVLKELVNAPIEVRKFAVSLPWNSVERVYNLPEIEALADSYVTSRVIGLSNLDDCLHIAAASVFKADVLVSWNFRHIVNSARITGYNDVNSKLGYNTIEIKSPKQLI